MKRRLATLTFMFLALIASAWAQQITRIAVVDLNRIIMSYSKDAQAMKDFETRKSQIQSEIDRMSEEIKKLQAQKVDADKASDKPLSSRLDSDIGKKTAILKDYIRSMQAELDDQAKKIASASPFVQEMYRQIQMIAETEGYSLVLNLKAADSVMSSVLWYSPMIDITDKVIQALMGKKP